MLSLAYTVVSWRRRALSSAFDNFETAGSWVDCACKADVRPLSVVTWGLTFLGRAWAGGCYRNMKKGSVLLEACLPHMSGRLSSCAAACLLKSPMDLPSSTLFVVSISA